MSVNWAVSARASACLLHTARTGALSVQRVTLGVDQTIVGYDYHSRHKQLDISKVGVAFAETDGIGALILDNSASDARYVFYFYLEVTDPADTGLAVDLLAYERVHQFQKPTIAIGEDYEFANRTLDLGACRGVFCRSGKTQFTGNTDGVPSTCDGDPIYEPDGDEPATGAIALAAGIVVVVLGVGMVLACWWWHKNVASTNPELERRIEIGEEADSPAVAGPVMTKCDAYGVPGDDEVSRRNERLGADERTFLDSPYGGVGMAYSTEPAQAPLLVP
jgi:hypothetical protein